MGAPHVTPQEIVQMKGIPQNVRLAVNNLMQNT